MSAMQSDQGFQSKNSDAKMPHETQYAMPPPGVRAEGGPIMLPATVYKPPSKPARNEVPMLESTPIKQQDSQTSGSRSPRFREYLPELDDTSSTSHVQRISSPINDSPTLGRYFEPTSNVSLADKVTRRQHMMSWNNYDASLADSNAQGDENMEGTMGPKRLPSARSPEQVSPELGNEPRDSKFVVSPLRNLVRRQEK